MRSARPEPRHLVVIVGRLRTEVDAAARSPRSDVTFVEQAERRGTGHATRLGFEPSDPRAYGRSIRDADGALERVVETADATDEEWKATLCNAGANVGSGSVMTRDVPDAALAIGRARRIDKPGFAAQLRAKVAAARRGQLR